MPEAGTLELDDITTEAAEAQATPAADETADDAGQAEGQTQAAEAEQAGEEDSGEVVITIGDEAPAAEEEEIARAPDWVRDLRKANRDKDRKLREQEAEIARLKGSGSAATVAPLGVKPTLAACDYDSDKYETDLAAWYERKREADDQKAKQDKAEETARAAWQSRLDAYGKAKGALKVKDFEDAEASVQEVMSVTQQGVILNGADNPAVLVYALGRNPKKAKELAAITDPVKFAFAVAKLETQLKVTPRKAAPVPERVVRGGVPGALAGGDPELDRLRADADKTGDRTRVAQYLRQKAQKGSGSR